MSAPPGARPTIDAAALVGTAVGGRYEVGSILGRGGMGVVYRARDRESSSDVALKVLHVTGDDRWIPETRFRLEARAASLLRHPNTVRVTDFGATDSGLPFYVMELLEGRDLKRVLGEEGQLSVPRALRIAKEVALSLDEAHRIGVVHRDVKPANLVLGSGDRVKVVDFGVLTIMDGSDLTVPELTEQGYIVGTALYLSPEAARGADVDGRTDLYALGCVLFEMLAGRPPFEDDGVMRLLLRHIGAPIPKPSDLAAGVPPEVDALVTDLLAKHRDDRPRTAGEVARRIDALLESLEREDPGSGAGDSTETVLLDEATAPEPARMQSWNRPVKAPGRPVPTRRRIPAAFVFVAFAAGAAAVMLAILRLLA